MEPTSGHPTSVECFVPGCYAPSHDWGQPTSVFNGLCHRHLFIAQSWCRFVEDDGPGGLDHVVGVAARDRTPGSS